MDINNVYRKDYATITLIKFLDRMRLSSSIMRE